MADQKHTLRLVAKLDTSDVQRELAKLNGGRSGGLNVGTRTGGGAYPSGANRGENSLALAANRLATTFDRLQGVFGKLEHGFGSVNDQVAGFKDSLKGMTRAVDAAKRAAERSTRSAASVGFERFRERYEISLKADSVQRSQLVGATFANLEHTLAGPKGRQRIAYAREMQNLALHALAAQNLPPQTAYRYYTAAGTMGTLQKVGDNIVGASFGKMSVYNPRYLKRDSPISHMRPGFAALPDLRGMFGAVFHPENDDRNYEFVKNPDIDPVVRRREELRRAGASARRWAAMFATQAVFSGGQRLASAYGAPGWATGTLGLLGSMASGAISGGAIGGMFGFGAGAMPGAIIGGALGLGTGVVNLVAGNVEEGRADKEAMRSLRHRLIQSFGLQELAGLGPTRAAELLAERTPFLEESRAKLIEGGFENAKAQQAEAERYQFLQQQITLLKQLADAEGARVQALRASRLAFDQMKNSRAWGQHMAMFAEGKNLPALNRILGSETEAMNAATNQSDYAVHANRVDQLKAMIKGIEAEFEAMKGLRAGRAFTGLLGGLVKGGDFDALSEMIAKFEELAKNATGLKELSEALSKLASVEGARDRVQAFRDMKENWEWGGWIWSLGKDKDLSMLHSAYTTEWLNRNSATNIEDWNLAHSRIGTIQSTADKIVREMVSDLESRMPKFDASLTTSLAQFGISMGEANDNVSRQMQVWEEQTEIQKQIRDLIEQNKWTSEYQ